MVQTLTSAEVAHILKVPVRTLDDWAYKGEGPAYSRVGRYRRYTVADVEAYLVANRHGGEATVEQPPVIRGARRAGGRRLGGVA